MRAFMSAEGSILTSKEGVENGARKSSWGSFVMCKPNLYQILFG
jgi:hypothetical protein